MSIPAQLNEIYSRLQKSEQAAGRPAGSVQLLAVSKTFPAEDLQKAYECGQRLFGENKVQEALSKSPLLPSDIEWHLIGPLQRNKVRKALSLFTTIHSIDSLRLTQYVDSVAKEMGLRPQLLFEVNVGSEESKFGFSPEEIRQAWPEILTLQHILPVGLMCIPPAEATAEETQAHFRALRELKEELEQIPSCPPLPHLSMGMSHDFELAIAEGATYVRVGSAIFGKR